MHNHLFFVRCEHHEAYDDCRDAYDSKLAYKMGVYNKLHLSLQRITSVTRSLAAFRPPSPADTSSTTRHFKGRGLNNRCPPGTRDGCYARGLQPGAYKCSNSFRAVAANARRPAVVRRYTSRGLPVYTLRGIYRDRRKFIRGHSRGQAEGDTQQE